MDIGGIFREHRRQRRETLQTVSDRAGTDPGNLSRVERNRQQVTIPQMIRLCDALGMSLEQFARELEDRRQEARVKEEPATYKGGGRPLRRGDKLMMAG